MLKKYFPIILIIVALSSLVLYGIQGKGMGSNSAEIEKIVKDTILANGKLIIDSVNQYQMQMEQKEYEDSKQKLSKRKDDLMNDNLSPFVGNENANVTIVEFFDYNCVHCRKTSEVINQLIAVDANVKVIMRELPILGKLSEVASRAALAVNKLDKNKYLAFHNALMKDRLSSEEAIFEILKKQDFDIANVKNIMNSDEVNNMIKNNHQLAAELGLRGTPAFVIGDDFIPGAINLDTLKMLIEKVRNS